MGCHGHGYSGHGCWQGERWEGARTGYGRRWDEGSCLGEPYVRGPYVRRGSPQPYGASRVSPTAAAAQLEAHLAALRDEMRAVEADLAEMRAAGERATRPDREV
jgi:hypothetical protein